MKRLTYVFLALGLALGFSLSYVQSAQATRAANGTYTLAAGNPVTTGTTISSSWANNTLSDLETAMSESLHRGGYGAMTAALKSYTGTVAAPGICFDGDTDTGLYRIGANNPGMAANGVKIQEWSNSASTFTVGVVATGVDGGGDGLSATGGQAHGVGVRGAGVGVGEGAVFSGGVDGGNGLESYGGATGVGVYAQGGPDNGTALSALGIGSGFGISATGGASQAGGTFASGTAATSTARQTALILANGDLDLSGVAYPIADAGINDKLTPANIVKAWGSITTGAATATFNAGFNITNATCAGNVVTVSLAQDMASTSYAVVAASSAASSVMAHTKAAGTFVLQLVTMDGVTADLCTSSYTIDFLVLGAM